MNLHIIELEGREILWRYNDMDGNSRVMEGIVIDAILLGGEVLLTPDAARRVIAECQERYNTMHTTGRSSLATPRRSHDR